MGVLGQAAHGWLCDDAPPRWPIWGSTNECSFAALHREGGGTIVGIAALLFTAVLAWPLTPAQAQTWTGPGTDYNTAANWTPNTVPATPVNSASAVLGKYIRYCHARRVPLCFWRAELYHYYDVRSRAGIFRRGYHKQFEQSSESGRLEWNRDPVSR